MGSIFMGRSVKYFTLLHMKMEPIEGSEMSAFINQTPGNYPKGNLLHSVHGESLKWRINYNTLAIYTTSQPVGLVAKLLSVYGLNIFLLLHMSCGWLQDCTSGQFINFAAEQTDGMTDLRFTQRSHWTLLWQQFGSDFTAQCCVVTERYSNKLDTGG